MFPFDDFIIYISSYGGPSTQLVTEQYQVGWQSYMTSEKHVISVSVDGRGSGGRGDRWLHRVYGNLGGLEVQDQIKAAEWVTS